MMTLATPVASACRGRHAWPTVRTILLAGAALLTAPSVWHWLTQD
jgi:hypothetical protein